MAGAFGTVASSRTASAFRTLRLFKTIGAPEMDKVSRMAKKPRTT